MKSRREVAAWFTNGYRDLNIDPDVMTSVIVYGVLAQILKHMDGQDMSMADLSRKMNVSRAAITRLFNAENPTVKRLAKLASAAGCVIDVPEVKSASEDSFEATFDVVSEPVVLAPERSSVQFVNYFGQGLGDFTSPGRYFDVFSDVVLPSAEECGMAA